MIFHSLLHFTELVCFVLFVRLVQEYEIKVYPNYLNIITGSRIKSLVFTTCASDDVSECLACPSTSGGVLDVETASFRLVENWFFCFCRDDEPVQTQKYLEFECALPFSWSSFFFFDLFVEPSWHSRVSRWVIFLVWDFTFTTISNVKCLFICARHRCSLFYTFWQDSVDWCHTMCKLYMMPHSTLAFYHLGACFRINNLHINDSTFFSSLF